ncbi:hypothetical protein SGQ44_14725 [Flavobacterium sp. Fl-77]|uniref:Uncharacterized protein n=1 Tax=Flavobacterium flavipigmentatum TaxID=2893884 RepID=A0AAJ2SER5_9FLAO|nr:MULTISPECIES: hypothetical protein [unclassified Flavobacterium]MDX6183582.1 hypothetical protein [Flavobacterium sp. Fl-33]MDX6187016.1 hypothetical protein [Flavobacterium sp. Fl-77]UFH40252.1 hypothetical protein LNP22_08225 [Flavobacterium sp. F-70]
MSQILKYAICFLVSLFILSCNNEEVANKNTSVNLSQVKKDLYFNKFSNVNIAENLAVDWETIKETQIGNFKIAEIQVHEKRASTLESNFLDNHIKYQIATIESEGRLNTYFIEAYTNKGSTIYPESITKLNDFTGTLNVFLLNGQNLGSVALYNGRARNISENDTLNVLAESINAFVTRSDSANKIPQCGGNYTVFIDQTISRFDVWTVGEKIVAINYLGTTTTRTSSIMPFPCDGVYDKNDILNQRLESYNFKASSGGTNGEIAAPQIFNELTGKAKCLNDLLTKNGNSFVQKILVNFEGKSTFNVKLVSKDKVISEKTGLEINGQTLPPKDNLIVIEISTSKANENSALDVVRTILHEYIHADLHSKTFTEYYKGETGFKLVSEMYANQHAQMASVYLNSMKQALKEFHKTILIDDYNKYIAYYGEVPSDAFYEALAWGGLRDNDVNTWTDLPADKKTSIINLANRAAMLSRITPCAN